MDSAKLRRQLVLHEGYRLEPYTDSVGKVTVGIGHNLTDNGISTGVCEELYHEDVANAMATLATLWPDWSSCDDVRQRVFVDLAFNLGERLATFHDLLSYAKVEDWDNAALALNRSRWYTQVGDRGPRLVTMLRTGQDPPELA